MRAISLRPHRTWSALLADGFSSFSQTMHPASTQAISSTAVRNYFLLGPGLLSALTAGRDTWSTSTRPGRAALHSVQAASGSGLRREWNRMLTSGGSMRTDSLKDRLAHLAMATVFLLTGCTKVLVKDDVHETLEGSARCSGGVWTDDSSLAVLPVPFVALFVPHFDLHEIRADDYLHRCGDASRLANRRVEVFRYACIQAGLTRIITLGIWQWCPVHVSWEADVKPASSSSSE